MGSSKSKQPKLRDIKFTVIDVIEYKRKGYKELIFGRDYICMIGQVNYRRHYDGFSKVERYTDFSIITKKKNKYIIGNTYYEWELNPKWKWIDKNTLVV